MSNEKAPACRGFFSAIETGSAASIQLGKSLDQLVDGLHLTQERLQLGQWQGARAITARRIRIRVRLDKQTRQANRHPGTRQFNHLLRALFQADRKVLEENFRIDFQDLGEGRWSLVLTPTTTPLNTIFATLDLGGATFLESIRLNDKQGDRTDITLSSHRLTPASLTDDERQRFAAP